MSKKKTSKPQRDLGCLERYISAYFSHRPDHKLLQEHLDTQVAAYEAAEAKRIAQESQPDDEGFITVTAASRKRTAVEDSDMKAKEKNYELTDFYRFQIKKAKIGDPDTLQQRFRRDLQMIASLKANKIL